MTRLEYDLLREDRPDLKLAHWNDLSLSFQTRVADMSRMELIAKRTALILSVDWIDSSGQAWNYIKS